jgi:hypothetical protein
MKLITRQELISVIAKGIVVHGREVKNKERWICSVI